MSPFTGRLNPMRRSRLVAVAIAIASSLLNLATARADIVAMYGGQILYAGQSVSDGSICTLTVQFSDGNVVEYCGGSAHWSAYTINYLNDYLVMQTDGNLVAYDQNGHWIWQTATFGYSGSYLKLQDDHNLVVYDSGGTARWAVSWTQNASGAQTYTQYTFFHYGWSVSGQWGCMYNLWQQESGWTWNATNPTSGAYGIPQSLPASKMAAAGTDWQSDGLTQVHWGEDYIAQSYGNPCGAWNHEVTYGWY
jgi:hypothetical protein